MSDNALEPPNFEHYLVDNGGFSLDLHSGYEHNIIMSENSFRVGSVLAHSTFVLNEVRYY